MNKIYKYNESFRRMGNLSGVFIADDAAVTRVRDAGEVYLGEVLGKHSEVTATIDDGTLRLISDDQVIVGFFEEHLDGGVGVNPVRRWLEQDDDDDDDDE